MNLQAMQEGKRRADERKALDYAIRRKQYLAWVKDEKLALLRRDAIEAIEGRDSQDWREANARWIELWATMPTPPPDHAWS